MVKELDNKLQRGLALTVKESRELYQYIKSLEQEPCDDAISRQAVLDIDFKRIILTTAKPTEMIEQKVKALSPVKQEPKTGHWIPTYGNVKCSVCGSVKDSRDVGKATHYCDFCGAKMEN